MTLILQYIHKGIEMDTGIFFCLLLGLISTSAYGNAPEHNHVDIDLTTGVVRGYSEQIRFLLTPTQSHERSSQKGTGVGQGQRCSRRSIIRVDFDSTRYKVARVVLKYGDSPRRWTFDASDSLMADGYGSVVSSSAPASSNQAATTEIHVMNRQLRVYGRWPAPSHNLYGRSSSKPDSDAHLETEEEESEETSEIDESEETDEVEADPVPSPCDDEEEEGPRCAVAPQSTNHHHVSPFPGSRMFMRVIDGTIRPNSRVELLVSAKGKSLWWRDGRLSHHLPAPPGFLRRRGSSLYLSFNRVLAGEWRAGMGLCSVSVQMMEAEDQCPKGQNFCDRNAICKPSRRGYQCSCKKGWQGDGKSCIDIDECRIKNGGCAHICHNEQGSFSCSCLKGFIQDPADPHNCIDVNECTTKMENGNFLHSCAQICKNGIGSYECSCKDGYFLASDGRSCNAGVQSCPVQLGCKHGCEIDFSMHVGTKVGIKCTCPAGYSIDDRDMKSCIPSCSVGNGGCQHHCHEVSVRNSSIHKGTTIGTLRPVCTCQPKYILGPDGKSCSASCSVNNGGCQKRCTTTDTGVVCSCPIGYILNEDGKTCTDIDECTSGNVTCEYGCANSVGSFECICPPGYRLNPSDERTCLDMDECSIEKTCEHRCVNIPGSYRCECEEGYQLFGVSHCGDINECSMDNGGCSHNCINTEGSYYCTCNNDYKVHANGKDCIGVESPNSFSCGMQTKYQSVSSETSGEMVSSNSQRCLDSVSSPRYMMTARFFFTGTKCSSLVQMKATSEALIEELNANNVETCSNECRLQVSKVRCENSKRVLKKLGKEKGEVVRVVFQIVSHPSNNSASCRGNCVKKSSARILWQAATHLRRSLNGARFSVKPLDEELIIIPKSFHARRNIQQTCYESTNASKEMCGFCPPGTYSSNGFAPCHPCPVGTYQPYHGKLNCLPTSSKSTVVRGAKSFSEASSIEPCPPGKYYNKDVKSCEFCPKGAYQYLSGQNYCFQCPGNSSTDYIGSKSVNDCKRSNCVSFINDMYGVIESPNYPGNYPNNIDCTWIVKPGRGRRLLVIVPDIKLSNDNCGDYLVMRKAKSPYSVTTYEACKSSNHPIAFTARSKRLWMQFKSNGNNTAGGFQIPFVTYNEEYQALIEDIVQDSRLYTSVNHLRILQDRKLLLALMEVIAQPINYYKYASDQRKILPSSFIRLMTPKVRKFFSYR